MRGGRRSGSGRPGRNHKVESLLSIDIRRWAARGLLFPDNYFNWPWSRDGERIASISVRITSPQELSLEYNWPRDGVHQHVTERILLERTECHFGGSRDWFRCPHCSRRVAKLYFVQGHWRCRKSLNISYLCQSENLEDRMHRRITKLESKLAEDGKKPKWMHWTTYNRIIKKLDDAECRMDDAFLQNIERLFGPKFAATLTH